MGVNINNQSCLEFPIVPAKLQTVATYNKRFITTTLEKCHINALFI